MSESSDATSTATLPRLKARDELRVGLVWRTRWESMRRLTQYAMTARIKGSCTLGAFFHALAADFPSCSSRSASVLASAAALRRLSCVAFLADSREPSNTMIGIAPSWKRLSIYCATYSSASELVPVMATHLLIASVHRLVQHARHVD
eukprot:CAMPEP_0119059490 /NCGR_PEP_ID=MMETSP1178-20130426/3645_1 /TAXON_ID=33656 /ORGANISM="unid sp, Strain CCMP2000" /LENGTH=147 /DNA_ID=CAMNT_0007040531 /DNA_START=60 /DNA_END=505 /DNA_ORIENTATION=+